MTFAKRLLVTELYAQLALLACAILISTGFWAWSAFEYPGNQSPEILPLVFMVVYVYGFLPVAAYGAPLYALARHLGYANWTSVLLIGALPGGLLAFLDAFTRIRMPFMVEDLIVFFLGSGVFVASLTHELNDSGAAMIRSVRLRLAANPGT